MLSVVISLQHALEAYHSTLSLPAKLTRCQSYLDSQYSLLYTHAFIQLSQAINGNILIFKSIFEVILPLD